MGCHNLCYIFKEKKRTLGFPRDCAENVNSGESDPTVKLLVRKIPHYSRALSYPFPIKYLRGVDVTSGQYYRHL